MKKINTNEVSNEAILEQVVQKRALLTGVKCQIQRWVPSQVYVNVRNRKNVALPAQCRQAGRPETGKMLSELSIISTQ